jgi:hypothetical protein
MFLTVAGTTSPDGQTAPTANAPAAQSSSTPTTQTQSLSTPTSAGATAQTTTTTTGTHAYDLYYDASISNTVNASATSGDVAVIGNTSAGSATSGMASSMANIINMLQSSWNPNGNVSTFNVDITGDVYGDMYIDPAMIPAPVPGAEAPSDVEINASTNAEMQNNIVVDATSGDVDALRNTNVGDATSGGATAIANVVNMINTAIASGQSFMGSINIYGNYNGDILLPEEALQALLASNVPRTTISTAQIENTGTVNTATSQAIANNATATATSGTVNTSGNTSVGNATSGDASTNITVLNLTGQQVIGKNALLVFVNVTGQWVGMIVNAPDGSTAAALGGSDSIVTGYDTDIDASSNLAINNTVSATAQSGNVNVNQNSLAGDATSGDAHAAINIANLSNSGFSLSNWFGILFINVFGSWKGSFGVNTEAGNAPVSPAPSGNNDPTAGTSTPQVFRFVPTAFGQTLSDVDTDISSSQEVVSSAKDKGVVLAASSNKRPPTSPQKAQKGLNISALLPVSLLGLLAAGGTEVFAKLHNRRKQQ